MRTGAAHGWAGRAEACEAALPQDAPARRRHAALATGGEAAFPQDHSHRASQAGSSENSSQFSRFWHFIMRSEARFVLPKVELIFPSRHRREKDTGSHNPGLSGQAPDGDEAWRGMMTCLLQPAHLRWLSGKPPQVVPGSPIRAACSLIGRGCVLDAASSGSQVPAGSWDIAPGLDPALRINARQPSTAAAPDGPDPGAQPTRPRPSVASTAVCGHAAGLRAPSRAAGSQPPGPCGPASGHDVFDALSLVYAMARGPSVARDLPSRIGNWGVL